MCVDISSWSTERRLAYLGGLIDGEGCIGVRRRAPRPANKMRAPTFTLTLGVEMTDLEPISVMAQQFQVEHLIRKRLRSGKHKDIFVLVLTGRVAAAALKALRPFLTAKADQAAIALEFWAHRCESRQHRTKVLGLLPFKEGRNAGRLYQTRGLSDEFIAGCESFYQRMKKREQRSRWENA